MLVRLLTGAALAAALTLSAGSAEARPAGATAIPGARSPDFGAVPAVPCRGGDRHHARSDARFGCGALVGGWVYEDGEWARYNNRSWGPASYNDWWNHRPDRAYPRWVKEQHERGTCDPDRMWWSGSGWHC